LRCYRAPGDLASGLGGLSLIIFNNYSSLYICHRFLANFYPRNFNYFVNLQIVDYQYAFIGLARAYLFFQFSPLTRAH